MYAKQENTENDNSTYYEIILNVTCEEDYLQDILMQNIADIILKNGDGIEFLDSDMIDIQTNK